MKKYNYKTHPQLFHISDENHDGKTFKPRVPKYAKENDEDFKTKRICVSTSITGCINALDPCRFHPSMIWYVHVPVDLDSLYEKNSICVPNKTEVPDVAVTKEKWITKKTKLKCIGIIKNVYNSKYGRARFTWIKKF